MASDNKKAERLTKVAKLYYENKLTQNEIANELNVSRPMVSKLLAEALDLGIVTITISETGGGTFEMAKRLRGLFGLKSALVLPDAEDGAQDANFRIVKAVFEIVRQASGGDRTLAVGWGQMIEELCALEPKPVATAYKQVIPLSGGFDKGLRLEHNNAFVFSIAEKLGAVARPLFLPSGAVSEAEFKLLKSLQAFNDIQEQWEKIDSAIIEVLQCDTSDGPWAGKIMNYYFDSGGIFQKNNANRICASVQQLRKAKNILLLADSEISGKTLLGALKTGIFTHTVFTDHMAKEVFSLLK